jgi:nicotinate-nucleotide adenylyltransferase
MSRRRIGILGGTFDPIHSGHIDAGHAAALAIGLQRIVVVPSHIPPHRPQPMASAYHRFAMVSLAVAGNAGWRASDLELRHAAPSYTTETLAKFHERGYAPDELFFVVGADSFAEIGSWKDFPAILDLAHFAVVSRPGHPADDLANTLPQLKERMTIPPIDDLELGQMEPLIFLIEAQTADVSSTAIRQRCAAGESIAGMVAPAVQQHIEQHGLYTVKGEGRRGNDIPKKPAAGRLHGKS